MDERDVAFMFDGANKGARFHHVAYWLDTPQDILHALSHFAEQGIRADLGPGMHGITQAFYSYIRDPSSGHLLELFSGGYLSNFRPSLRAHQMGTSRIGAWTVLVWR